MIVVANIAQNLLLAHDQTTFDAANELLKLLRDADPYLTSHENLHSFVESATFADDIKYHGGEWQADYHFVDVPYVDEGSASDYSITTKAITLTQGIQNIVDWLSGKNGEDYQSSYMYTQLNNLYPGQPDLARSYALRLLIHYIGDISQPFHCESRFDSAYPTGDAGANAFPLPSHYTVDELHALIDKVLYVERNNIPRVSRLLADKLQPMADSDWANLSASTSFYQNTYEASCCHDSSTWDNQNFGDWQTESYNIATTLYDGKNPPLI